MSGGAWSTALRVLPLPLTLWLGLFALRDLADAGHAATAVLTLAAVRLGAAVAPAGAGPLFGVGAALAWLGALLAPALPVVAEVAAPVDGATLPAALALGVIAGALSPRARRLPAPDAGTADPAEGLEQLAPLGMAALAGIAPAGGAESLAWLWLLWLGIAGSAAFALRRHVAPTERAWPLLAPSRLRRIALGSAGGAALSAWALARYGAAALPFAALCAVLAVAVHEVSVRLTAGALRGHEASPFRGGSDEPAALLALVTMVPALALAAFAPRSFAALTDALAAPAEVALVAAAAVLGLRLLSLLQPGRRGPSWRRVAFAAPPMLVLAAGLAARRTPPSLGVVVVELSAFLAAASIAALVAWTAARER